VTSSAPASPSGSADRVDSADPTSWRVLFGNRGFRRFLSARWFSMLAMQMQSVAIGWQIYAITRRPLDLAWVGLAQFLPAAGLALITGHVADRFDRRSVLKLCHVGMAVLSLVLFGLARSAHAHVSVIYAVLVGVGVARAFLGPSNQSLLPSLVPTVQFPSAVAWASSLMQAGMVAGPSIGGALYGAFAGPVVVYGTAAACSCVSLVQVVRMGPAAGGARRPSGTRSSLLAGVRYVRGNPIVLGAISLDLFAVLLGGATALLPVYARDVLHLGPSALGTLRSAPALGAALTGLWLATHPVDGRAGIKMLGSVALFGAATIVFGVSRNFLLSLAALVLTGAADMVSVFVRSSLVQLATPDAMRGRVSAVNMVFIGASNEFGEFESGITAQWLGAVPSVVLGGIGTLIVVALWAVSFPELRRVNRLTDVGSSP
jgi:MFS family permease